MCILRGNGEFACYSVWVGGSEINDFYLTFEEATILKKHWIKQGYKDTKIRKEV